MDLKLGDLRLAMPRTCEIGYTLQTIVKREEQIMNELKSISVDLACGNLDQAKARTNRLICVIQDHLDEAYLVKNK